MIVERREIVDRNEWIEWRRPYIGASQIGALFSCHPYCTPLHLYLEKSGIEFENKDNPAMRRGRLLEPAVALAVAEERPDWKIIRNNIFFCDSERKIAATPDFFIEGDARGVGVLQAKTVAPKVYARDWSDGSPPFWITLQCLQECMLTDAAFGVVAALVIDPFDLVCSIHEIERHPSAEAKIIAAVKQFWDDVAHGREPEPDYGKDAALLSILAPRESSPDKAIDLSGNNELPGMLAERELLHARMRQDKERCEEIEAFVKFLLRDNAKGSLPGWSITWKTQHRSEYMIPEKDIRVLRIHTYQRSDDASS